MKETGFAELAGKRKLARRIALAGLGLVIAYALYELAFPILLIGGGYLTTGTDEISRVTSPDGLVDAVVTRTDAGALESFYYHVYIVLKGSKKLNKPILEGYGLDDSKMQWAAAGLLTITYTHACINAFSNHWSDPRLDNGSNVYDVETRLIPPEGPAVRQCD